MLIGTKLNTTPISLLDISLQSDTSPEEIAKYEVRLITEDEKRLLTTVKHLSMNLPYGLGSYNHSPYITFMGNTVFITQLPQLASAFPQSHFIAVLQNAAYYYNQGLTQRKIIQWFNYVIDGVYQSMINMASIKKNILGYEMKLSSLYNDNHKFQYLKIKELERACRKYKITYERIDEQNKLTFKKIRIGNNNEGWINYKFITLYLNDNLRIKRAVFGFNNKFIYDTDWAILSSTSFHPHISNSPTACFGNRDEDWTMYTNNYHYNFLVELLNETIRSYHPDSPFVNIITIASSLEVMKKKIKSVIALASDKDNLHLEDYLNYSESMLRNNIAVCPQCYSILGEPMPSVVDDEHPSTCQNITCVASLRYVKMCPTCNQQLAMTYWRAPRYRWECNSNQCNEDVVDADTRDEAESAEEDNIEFTQPLHCRVCERILLWSPSLHGWSCDDNACSAVNTIQYLLSEGSTVITLSLRANLELQLYHYRAEYLQALEEVYCSVCEASLDYISAIQLFICTDDEEHDSLTPQEYALEVSRNFGNFNLT